MTLYYAPENFGAELVGCLDTGGPYEYNILLVLKDKATGKLYYGQEAGCSCPQPFEDYNAVTELREIVSANEFAVWARQYLLDGSGSASFSDHEYVEKLITKVRRRLARHAV